MKRKILFLLFIFLIFLSTGCSNISKDSVKEKFIDKVNKMNSYKLDGTLSMLNNESTFDYTISVSFKKDDYYKVVMNNKSNNYQQTIFKNDDGVFVVTPALNKSFKFQSKWPYNNSQAYILKSLLNDLNNDSNFIFKENEDTFVLTTTVNYPNNNKLTKQNIIMDKNYNLKKVEVTDDDDVKYIEFVVTKFDDNVQFDNNYFIINENEIEEESKKNVDSTKENCTDNSCSDKETSSIDESLFPFYLPVNTTLSDKEVINLDDGKRIIMTFSGDNSFTLVQETVKPSEEYTVVPTYGEPYQLLDTIGSLTDISYTWVSGGIEYYIVSDVMNQNELLKVANSISIMSTINEK